MPKSVSLKSKFTSQFKDMIELRDLKSEESNLSENKQQQQNQVNQIPLKRKRSFVLHEIEDKENLTFRMPRSTSDTQNYTDFNLKEKSVFLPVNSGEELNSFDRMLDDLEQKVENLNSNKNLQSTESSNIVKTQEFRTARHMALQNMKRLSRRQQFSHNYRAKPTIDTSTTNGQTLNQSNQSQGETNIDSKLFGSDSVIGDVVGSPRRSPVRPSYI